MFGLKGVFLAMGLLWTINSYAELITPNVNGCLRVRSTPRHGHIKKCVKPGQSLNVVAQRGNWVKVDYGSGSGWTYRPMTKRYSGSDYGGVSTSTSSYITPDVRSCLNLRSSSRRRSRIVGCVKPGQKMEVLGRSGKRIKVKVGGKTGYVFGGLTRKHQGASENPSIEQSQQSGTPPQVVSGGGQPTSGKRKIDTFHSSTCEQIKRNKHKMSKGRVKRATQYFTPIFKNLSARHPVRYKGRYRTNRYWCKNVEGSCRVGNKLYNYGKSRPYNINNTACKFGFGNGKNRYNKMNCLDPCRTVATHSLPTGSVVYFPSLDGKICPQTGKRIDGCFVVSDVGDAIRGKGRFDLFAGECIDFKGGNCRDKYMNQFRAPSGSSYYVMSRHNRLSKELREESDLIIKGGWREHVLSPVVDAVEEVLAGFR